MKRIILFLMFFSFVLFSCELSNQQIINLSDYSIPEYSDFRIPELEYILKSYSLFSKKERIMKFILRNITWRSDQEIYGEEFFQSAKITWKLKQGDCDDIAILFLVLCKIYLNEKGFAVSVSSFDNKRNHMMPKIDNIYYNKIECFFDKNNNIQLNKIYNYDEIIKISEYVPSINNYIIIL